MPRTAKVWLVLALAGYICLPWYGLDRGFFSLSWILNYSAVESGSGFYRAFILGDRPWLMALLPILSLLFLTTFITGGKRSVTIVIISTILCLAWIFLQGFGIDHRGYTLGFLTALFGAGQPTQAGFGAGAALTAFSLLMLLSIGLAGRGFCRGDMFVVGAIATVIALVGLFVFFPVARILSSAVQDNDGHWSLSLFFTKFLDASIWGVDCFYSALRCGVAWNTVILGILVGVGATAIGLAFALVAVRTGFRFKAVLRIFSVLPVITPPFVIGLAIILMFGRAGAVSSILYDWFDIPRSRWIYGLPGVLIAQLLAFTPIAFLVLIGVVQGIAPSLEEASQTLRADRWTTFRTVTWPLLRPGIANAFLLGFVESLADFGNPLVLGGNFEVLSTKIFFAVVGAAHDQGQAAVLAIVLLIFSLAAFFAQQYWLGNRSYTTMTGKGDAGLSVPLPRRVRIVSYGIAAFWSLFTAAIYLIILVGGFVKMIGRDNRFTIDHYLTGFSIEWGAQGLRFSGSAWDSFFATLYISVIAAPLTAALGLLIGYLLVRQKFHGQRLFEFGTLLSFAIPGTVIGISYILAFNVPPLELTGTGLILVICFIFRNLPVGVRSGIATLSQIDKSLDEVSLTLGASSAGTIRRVIMPLLRPAIIAALIYSFVRAMTAVSAIIFLVTPQYNMATAYIVGRVEAGEFGLAIAYSSVLIIVMVIGIVAIQFAVGERRLGRRGSAVPALGLQGAS